MRNYLEHIKFNFFKLGVRKTIGYKKLIETFHNNEWVKVDVGYTVYYYSSNVINFSGKTMPVRNRLSDKVIIIDLETVFILNPFTYYRFFKFLKANPPLTTQERKINKRDELIDIVL